MGVCFSDSLNGVAVGNDAFLQGLPVILHTTDGGASWVKQTYDATVVLKDVFFVSTGTGIAVGTNGVILRTTNGGNEWSRRPSGSKASLNKIIFLNSNVGMAVGMGGGGHQSWCEILRSTDGGITWTSTFTPTTSRTWRWATSTGN